MNKGSADTLARRAFAAGGPIHGVGFGVLTGVQLARRDQ
jgi:hypothetical protein